MPQPHEQLPPGYALVRSLGRGAQGEVFLADHPASGTRRAVKVLDPPRDPAARARYEREFEFLVTVRHPHIVSAHDFGCLPDGRPYLVLDFLAGGSLADRRLPVPPGTRDAWLSQLLDALDCLHSLGLLHLDLKPENLLFEKAEGGAEAPLRVGDFGLLGRLGEVPQRAGTPGYLAPEVLHGAAADARADLYGVGVLAVEMTTGQRCFPGDSPDERMERQVAGSWEPGAVGREPELLAVVQRLLSPQADLRPDGVAALRRLHPAWAARPGATAGVVGERGARAPELAEILAAVEAAPPCHVRVTGPPGSGRSTLLRAALARLRTRGRRALLVDAATRDLPRTLAAVPDLEMLLVDDFHRLGPEALAALAAWRAGAPSAALVAAGDDALLPGAARAALRGLAPGAQAVRLGPLPREDLEAVLRESLPLHVGPELEAAARRGSGGQPGPLREFCARLKESGALQQSGGVWRLDPEALERCVARAGDDPLVARLSALPAGLQRFVWVAAWLGEAAARERAPRFRPPLEPPASLLELRTWLRDPQRLRAAADAALPAGERGALAGACLDLEAELEAGTRAELAARAGRPELAAQALLEAARESGAPARWRQALAAGPAGPGRLAVLDPALDAFAAAGGDPAEEGALRERLDAPAEPLRRAELLRRLGWCQVRRGEPGPARAPLEEAARLGAADAELRAHVLADLGWLCTLEGRPGEARERYREGLESAPAGAHTARSRLLNRLGALAWQEGQPREAEERLRQAVEEARLADDLAAENASWSNLCLLLQDQGRAAEGIRLGEELLARCQGRPAAAVHVPDIYYRLATAHRHCFQYREACAAARRALDAAEAAGERALADRYLVVLAQYEFLVGRIEEAGALLAETSAAFGGQDRAYSLALRGEIALERGDLAAAVRLEEAAYRLQRRRGEPLPQAMQLSPVLEAAAAAGDRAKLQRTRDEAERAAARPMLRRGNLTVRLVALEARAALGEPPPELLAGLEALSAELSATDLRELQYRCARARAELALEASDAERAETALAEMDRLLQGAGAPGEATRAEELRGALRAVRGDLPGARVALQAAQRRYATLGLRLRQIRAQERLLALKAGPGGDGAPGEEVLLELTRLVHSLQSLEELLERSLDLLLKAFPAERAAIFLLDPERQTLGLAASRGAGGELAEEARRASASVLQQVLRSGQTVILGDAREEPGLGGQASVLDLGIRSVLCQPLVLDEQVVGTVYLDHRHRAGAFDAHHRGLLRGFSRLIAVAIDQSRTRARLVRAEELLRRENRQLRRNVRAGARAEMFVYHSPRMVRLLEEVARVAAHRTTVLLVGESGTGKECLAEILHAESPRSEGPLVRFNCAAVAPDLMEAEVFGIEAGTATGVGYRVGIFECADGGTLLLDEVGDMDLSLQAKLLRVLENGELRRVGGRDALHVDVRVIAATNRDLQERVREGAFRQDLFFRLSAVTLTLPPLRERREDILPLAEHFLELFAGQMGLPRPGLSAPFREYLLRHSWPGNVRELRNVIERALVSQAGPLLNMPQPLIDPEPAAPAVGIGEIQARSEAEQLRHALESCGWNQSLAARRLGVSEGTIRHRMRKLGIDRPS
ncbi:MAG TPA: sigma 54-interacting transcriptional regulator [Candidatus Saccharimonadales bacterium]|nr:sigma 54-interacting transcriptional regulator [Candidatus Saccharimonadales bacterium]